MTIFDSRFAGSTEVAEGTASFRFERPAGFAFRPGQAIELLLPGAGEDGKDAGHAFSLVSTPDDPELAIATRLRDSAYKRALRSLRPGAPVRIDGPFGSLTLHRDRSRPALLVAGGIGITPFRSMLRDAAAQRSPQRLVLVYSNRRPEDAAFLDELVALPARLPGFRLVATMTGMEHSSRPWDGPRAKVDAALLREAIARRTGAVAYVAGPPSMVAAMREALVAAGVDEDDVRSEEFFGY